MGNLDVADAVDHPGRTAFAAKKLEPYSVNGKQGGSFKTEGALSFLRVFKAGHEVMYYRKFFSFAMRNYLVSTWASKRVELWADF